MYHYYEMLNVMFFVQCLKFPDDGFNILDHITFFDMPTRSGSKAKLIFHCTSSNRSRHFYFNRIARLWNALPTIDISLSLPTIKIRLKHFFWSHFQNHFDPDDSCSFHASVLAVSVISSLPLSQSTLPQIAADHLQHVFFIMYL